ncbi:MAG TPA: M48 family metalloprotease [Kineosporiaceae bacterium]|nr:M48 family metalloprotease [Kineosporiaceae bacterium]
MTGLQPLAYHVDVTERLARLEPQGWQAFTAAAGSADPGGLHEDLARTAYRLDPRSHPRVGAAVAAAGAALGVEVPVTVYQLEGAPEANAALLYQRSEAVVTLSGDLLDRLTDPELTALLGHELAHHRLWTLDGGRYGVADRMLDALALDARTPEPFLETGRRWNLATELFADRGALAACGDPEVAIACLVKAATGLREVDAAGYVQQAEAADPAAGSRGRTHPETVPGPPPPPVAPAPDPVRPGRVRSHDSSPAPCAGRGSRSPSRSAGPPSVVTSPCAVRVRPSTGWPSSSTPRPGPRPKPSTSGCSAIRPSSAPPAGRSPTSSPRTGTTTRNRSRPRSPVWSTARSDRPVHRPPSGSSGPRRAGDGRRRTSRNSP